MTNSPTITQADRDAAWPYRPDYYLDSQKWNAGVYDTCAVIQAFARHREQAVAEKEAENARLRAFIQSIDDEWVSSEPASEDEWSDGYEDCLSEWAKKARQALEGRSDG